MNSQYAKGITLIELMVVVVIVAILAAVAYPSYRQQVMRTHRTDAKVALEQASQAMERCFTRAHSYADCDAPAPASPNLRYAIAFVGNPTTTTYRLAATPQGAQADDICGTLTLDHRGARGQAENATAAQCW